MAITVQQALLDVSGYTPSRLNLERLFSRPNTRSKAYSKRVSPLTSATPCIAPETAPPPELQTPYFWRLSTAEVDEIENSVKHFQRLNRPLHEIDPDTFPLTASLRLKLQEVLAAVYGDHKFMILCGLDPQRYNDVENVIIHAGLSSHVGARRGLAGYEGGDNTAVRSTGQYHGPPNQAREIPFHTDNGDIVSLFALSTSQSGGSFYLADSSAVYNDLVSLEPGLAKALTDDWTMIRYEAATYALTVFLRRSLDKATIKSTDLESASPSSPHKDFDKRPIAFPQSSSGQTLINCSRSRITGTPSSPRPSNLPPLTQTQKNALDALHELARQKALEIRLQPGDMIFFNNLSTLHARDAFVDNDAIGQKRHLLRLILRNEEKAYDLPSQLKETWKGLYEHDRQEELFPVKSELFTFASTH
ncbi:hypothetical protein ACLMJK_002450 [Lecanora helva]